MTVKDVMTYVGYMAEKKSIDAVCAMSPDDRVTLEAARAYQLSDKPRASRFLDHSLTGGGKNIELKTQELLDPDSGVRAKAFSEVVDKVKQGAKQVVVALPQGAFKNQDWRDATGSLNRDWQLPGSDIEFSFTKKYRWHPTVGRATQCVHQATENLKKAGAQEFLMVGASMNH